VLSDTAANKVHTVVGVWDGATLTVYQNGRLAGSTSASGTLNAAEPNPFFINAGGGGSRFAWNGQVYFAALGRKAIDLTLARELSTNPWQLFAPTPARFFSFGGTVAPGGTTDTALSTAGAATATLVGAAYLASTLSATGAAVGTLVGDVAAAFATTDLSVAGAATVTGVGARIAASVLMPHLGPEGQPSTSSAEFEGAALLAAHVSSTGAAVGTLEGTTPSNIVAAHLDSTGAATANAAAIITQTSDLDADGAAVGTAATASILASDLSSVGAAVGSLEATAVSGYETADLSATGTAVGTMAGAAVIGAALSAAGAAVARLSTVEPSTDNAYLTWGAEARRVRQLQEEDDEEILTMLASMMPAIRRRHGKSYARPTIRTHR